MKVAFIKALIREDKVLCPKCNEAQLDYFHKKAKKSNTEYICPKCGERYQVIKMMKELEG